VAQETSAIADGVPEQTDAASPAEETGPAAIPLGTRLGAYELGRRLGVGSMGAVYQGVRVADAKPVAIKVLAADLAEKPVARARFLNEAKLTAGVRHPHVVSIIDSGQELERVYLVMDLLEGEDLARRLHRSGPMSVGEAIEVLVPICDAVAWAHRGGVTHRDLKPSNIFLSLREGRLHPTLLDFGVATDEDGVGEGEAPGPLTWKGVGTPMYLAPELVTDHRAAGPLSDQYALGAILYETLTGQPPYVADDLQQLLRTIVAGHPPSARARRPEIPAELDSVVLRAMNADPEGRFPSVEDLARALRRFAASPVEQEQLRRRRPPSSPSIAMEAATPSPFVRTLVPELEAETGPWFVAPDASDELFDGPVMPWSEPASAEDDAWSAEDDGQQVEHDGQSVESDSRSADSDGVETESRGAEAGSRGVEVDGSRVEAEGPSAVDDSREEGRLALPARALFPVDWQAVSSFTAKHRRIVQASGIALLGIASLFVVRGGRSGSRHRSAPISAAPAQTASSEPMAPARAVTRVEAEPRPMAAPATVEKSEAVPVGPAAPVTVEKSEAVPVGPAASPTVEKNEAVPARSAPATVVTREVAPTRPAAAPTASVRADVSPARARVAHHERPAPARTESPTPKVASPAPASTPHAPESAPVRMHNGVPLLD
jgi:serine/threonine protein kinase